MAVLAPFWGLLGYDTYRISGTFRRPLVSRIGHGFFRHNYPLTTKRWFLQPGQRQAADQSASLTDMNACH